ncbi:MAG: hypothetical protein QMD06_01345 [Candidatus Altarchaeum sp.]|nr:hypothetical protein [Candidatus Altarchaeum sp.]
MKINMKIFLKDTPGSLIRVIEPISANNANIQSIVHSHKFKENDKIPVEIVFEIDDINSVENVKNALLNEGLKISEINIEGKKYYKKKTKTIIMVGHVIDKDIRGTIDRINEGGLVYDLSVIMKSPDSVSACMLKIEYDEVQEGQINETLNEICKEKGFLLISGLN